MRNNSSQTLHKNPINTAVIVAALGYFVDIYDLILFGIVRNPSLTELGLQGQELLDIGVDLLNMQMIGMLLGGIVWGILGDKKGRMAALFLTILIYSLANIANGFVQNLPQYYILRFIAGFGLAGELGIGITLVSEVMTKEMRGYGTAIVSGVGIAGAVLGFLVADMFDWRMAYWVGGVLGLLLLGLRIIVHESGMFGKVKEQPVNRGDFLSLFTDKKRLRKFVYCILIGVPVWYVIGILVIFSPEFAKNVFHINGEIVGGKAVMYHYIGASFGSLITGWLSQFFSSRKKALAVALFALTMLIAVYFCMFNASAMMFYIVIFLLGIAMGYWAVFITVASEQFGTNLRATVTTSAPNFVRGATVPITSLFRYMGGNPVIGLWGSGVIVGAVLLTLAFFSLYKIDETHGKDLDYLEDI